MANALVQRYQGWHLQGGQNGRREAWGYATFPTTATSCTLIVNGFSQVEMVQITPNNPAAGDGVVAASATVVQGTFNPGATGITISRAAGTTSGLGFWFLVRGS